MMEKYNIEVFKSMLGLLILIALGFAVYFYFDKKNFDNSEYKNESGNSYFATRFDTGYYGEYLSFGKLETISGFHKQLTNVYVPKEDGGTTEIDLVFIHETGIYVIESKNYSGWIFGSEKRKDWMQTLENWNKNTFFNPIWQNNTHIKYLNRLFKNVSPEHFKSIIVFSERCTLKKLEVYSPNVKVVKRYDLEDTINSLINNSRTVFTHEVVEDIYTSLKPYTCMSDTVKQTHVANIKKFK